MAEILRKRNVQGREGSRGVEPSPELEGTMPGLWAHLAHDHYPSGEVRQRSSLSVFVGDYGLQACLNDRDNGMVAFVTGTSLLGILEALEAGIQADALDWRKARNGPVSKTKRK